MSYAFDVMLSVWSAKIRPRLMDAEEDGVAMLFEGLIEAMHSANHRTPSADGVFSGDGINKDPYVSRAAKALAEYVDRVQEEGHAAC